MSHYDTGDAEPPRARRRHAPKRRGPGPLWMIGSGVVVLAGVLAAVTALDSGPAGRAPAVDGGQPGMPALIQRDGSSDQDSAGAEESGGPTAPSTQPSGATGTASATTSATASASATATAATATPSAERPGKSGIAPGKKKRE
ncbi:hypothetical protein [Streptomyces sp. NPDC053431]|uniref:hypothetical protein n=1 Tax=Streptomyces sp. NPDC053431 TaxID=3365703 RepID=UPI0037D257F0